LCKISDNDQQKAASPKIGKAAFFVSSQHCCQLKEKIWQYAKIKRYLAGVSEIGEIKIGKISLERAFIA
jgi:hypothetical protein